LQRTLRGHSGPVQSIDYSADGQRLVTASLDATIRIWPVGGGAPTVLYGHQGPVDTAAFDPSGRRVVSAGDDGTIRVWDVATDGSVVVLDRYALADGTPTVANGADFSPDGQRVVSAGGAGTSVVGTLRVSACEVCGSFADVLRLARSRAPRTLSALERRQLLTGGP
jgi:WD40 repeat protein